MATDFLKKIIWLAASIIFVILLLPGGICGNQIKPSKAFKFIKEDLKSGVKEYRLNSNGLTVLLQERHNAPVVTVLLAYKVGSRNEAVGYTGATHFLEHMMFKGSSRHDPLKGNGIDDILKATGGINNAGTMFDLTDYYEIVPSKYLPLCLELEADRMRHALLRDSDRKAEMTVVRNELETGENNAAEMLQQDLFATAFHEHPYHHPIIGWRSDVEGVPTSRLRQFYNDFYHPDNSVLVLVGDFHSESSLQIINRYFGALPRSKKPFPQVYTVEPTQAGERRFLIQKGQELPKLALAFHSCKVTNKDSFALDVLAAILGDHNRRSSRLYKRLIDSGLASQASTVNFSLKDPGLFIISATATQGSSLNKLEKIIEDELAKLANERVAEVELERARKAVWKRLKLESDDPLTFAELLAQLEASGSWSLLASAEKETKAVSAADITRVAKKYFSPSNRSVGFYLPQKTDGEKSGENSELASSATGEAEIKSAHESVKTDNRSECRQEVPTDADYGEAVQAKSSGKDQKTIASKTRKKVLKNGLTIYVLPQPGTGITAVSAKIKGGDAAAPRDKAMLARLSANMLNKGSRRYSKEGLADLLETCGTSFEASAETFWTEFESELLSEDLDKFFSAISDCIRDPLFEESELNKLKKLSESDIKEAMAETAELAHNKLLGSLYKPSCIYYQPPFSEQIAELSRISPEDLREFHKKNYGANNMYIAFVGDVSPERAFQLSEKYFGDWRSCIPANISVKSCSCAGTESGKQILAKLEDKSSLDIYMGRPADLSIKSKDFCAAQIANAALGHDTVSSRLAELRTRYGLTYGISSGFSEIAEPWSPWLIEFSVNPENAGRAIRLTKQIISNYAAHGLKEKELESEKSRIAGDYIVNRLRTAKLLASALSKYAVLGLGPEFIDRYPQMLNQVTLPQANAAIKKFMQPKGLSMSVAGNLPEDIEGK